MSIHHRAYEHLREGETYEAFCRYLHVLAERDGDKELKLETTTQQIWNTAKQAIDAGMGKHQAFPLTGSFPVE